MVVAPVVWICQFLRECVRVGREQERQKALRQTPPAVLATLAVNIRVNGPDVPAIPIYLCKYAVLRVTRDGANIAEALPPDSILAGGFNPNVGGIGGVATTERREVNSGSW